MNEHTENDLMVFMGEVREYMRNQAGRCSSHSASIRLVETRVGALEDTKNRVQGALQATLKVATLLLGTPAAAYLIYRVSDMVGAVLPRTTEALK